MIPLHFTRKLEYQIPENNTKNSFPTFFEIMAYNLEVMLFGSILKNQLFRFFKFRLFSKLLVLYRL